MLNLYHQPALAVTVNTVQAADSVGDVKHVKTYSKQPAAWLFQKEPEVMEKRAKV